jgi:hypothetical protein
MLTAQLVGIAGICLLFATFQFNNRRTILRIQIASGLVWAVHYLLLGALTGALMNGLLSGRNYFFEKYRGKRIILWISLAVLLSAGLLSWKDWSSILPILGSSIGTIAMWQKKPTHIRLLMLAVPPLWFVYNAINGSFPGMLGDTVTFTSVLVGIYRFDIRRQPEPATVSVLVENSFR